MASHDMGSTQSLVEQVVEKPAPLDRAPGEIFKGTLCGNKLVGPLTGARKGRDRTGPGGVKMVGNKKLEVPPVKS